ncbi:MAG: hypothetical protein QNJ73_06000 [Gammaproteobacteria bacterium]|nr:hypothetical protein [Gammaproteobacteria bacterium]
MWSSERLRWLVPLGLLATATGCGFQASSTIKLPQSVQSIYIDSADRYSAFYREFNQTMRQRGIELSPSPTDADAVLRIYRDETGQRVTSVSAQNKPRQFEVYYVVNYAVLINGDAALERRTVTALRSYSYDETQVLGKALEEESLRQALAEDLVGRVIRRMGTLTADTS